MFGMGMGEMIIIAIVALLALGPDKLPEAAKKIGETIRGLRRQTSELRKTIEADTQLGDAMREIRGALHDDPLRDKPKPKPKTPRPKAEGPPPDEAPPDEPMIQPAEDAVARGDEDADESANSAHDESASNGAAAAKDLPKKVELPPQQPYQLSDYEKYIHNNGPHAAAEKFGTSLAHAEAALERSLARATHDG